MDLYSDVDLPHEADDHPNWQESFVLVFRDRATDLVGFLRVGAYVNEGTAQVHWGLAHPDGTRFRRHRLDLPYRPEDHKSDRMTCGPMTYSIPHGDYVSFVASDPDCDVELRMFDWFPSQFWEGTGDISQLAAHHPESSGRVEGHVRLGERTFDIADGVGHRDHSWGPRTHIVIRNNRWVAGTVGPELSFSFATVQLENGEFFKGWWLVRDGKRQDVVDINTVVLLLADGFSTVGGWTEALLANGERIRVQVETIDGVVTSSHLNNGGPGSTPAGVEGLSIPRWNGHDGVCDFNINVNPLRGEQAVSHLLLANHEDGLTRRPDIDLGFTRDW
jgi:hypothetical protein